MDKSKLMQRLMATFLEELDEHVRTLNQDLLALEKQPAGDQRGQGLKALFRTAHSLKGAARSVNARVIEEACHRLEEILTAVRDGHLAFDPDLFALLFNTADALEEAGMRLREQQDLSEAPLAGLLPRLDKAVKPRPAAAGPAAQAAEDMPRPAPPEAAPAPAAPPPTPPQVQAAEMVPEPAAAAGSVRVPAEKLDTFLARIGELLVARKRVEYRVGQAAALGERVKAWRAEWGRVDRAITRLLAPEEDSPNGRDAGLGGGTAVRSLPRRAAQVLRQAGEFLQNLEKDLERLADKMAGDTRLLEQTAVLLDEEVRRVRMLPFAEACQGLDRTARDLARAAGKEVHLTIEGGSVELDRSVLEGLKDPLRHLVRNAVDHGAEPPEERRAAGKPSAARVTIAAALRGAQVEVVVRDDGRGLDREALREQAHRRHLAAPADEGELARLIFLPGLSTSRIITDVSGRGVGLDVVKSRVEALHGTVEVASEPGRGTRFTLTVPLTLTTLRAVLVTAAGQTFAFVGTNVQRLVRAAPAEIRSVAGREMLPLGGPPLPLASLAGVLGLRGGPDASAAPPGGSDGKKETRLPVVIVAAGERRMAFAVDEFLDEREIVVKSLGARVRRLRHVSAATLLPSGKIALVLSAAHLVRSALGRAAAVLRPDAGEAAPPAPKRLLVVDDSVTTRTLEKSILEAAGYEVLTAVDGRAAWQALQEKDFDLVVSDVDMPQMDGFALTEAVRASPRLKELPVVLVTARENDQDRTRGVEAGADAYLVKSGFDQKNLLDTIAQLL